MRHVILVLLIIVGSLTASAQTDTVQALDVEGRSQLFTSSPDSGFSLLVYNSDRILMGTLTIPKAHEIALIADSSAQRGVFVEYYGDINIRAVPENWMKCGPHWRMEKCFSYSTISLDLKQAMVRVEE